MKIDIRLVLYRFPSSLDSPTEWRGGGLGRMRPRVFGWRHVDGLEWDGRLSASCKWSSRGLFGWVFFFVQSGNVVGLAYSPNHHEYDKCLVRFRPLRFHFVSFCFSWGGVRGGGGDTLFENDEQRVVS